MFQEYGENQPTTQVIATVVWLIHPDVKPEEMLLPLNIRVFVRATVIHSDQLPIPIPPSTYHQLLAGESTFEDDDIQNDEYTLNPELEERKPYYPNQQDLNDLFRDLGLTKSNAELLTSLHKQWNLLNDSAHVTEQRKRHQNFLCFLLCKREFAFATVLVNFLSPWEFHVIQLIGIFSLTARQKVLRLCYFIKETKTHLFLSTIPSTSKEPMQMSKHYCRSYNMTSTTWRS